MENGTMGLEEYYEARIKTLNVQIPGTQHTMNIMEYYKNRPQFIKGVWDGFVLYVRAFRYFKARSAEELIDNMRKMAIEQQEQGQGQSDSDIDDADYWKKGRRDKS